MIRACIIGVSGFGVVHYNDLMREVQRGRMKAVGATIINQDEEQEKCAALRALGCEIFTDHRVMLAKFAGKVDLCFIPTGIHMHAPMSIDAMHAGANVFVEKPAAARYEDVLAMQQVERETGKFVAVGYQTMYGPDTYKLKEAIVGGRIGKVRMIRCMALWPRGDNYYSRNRWSGRIKVGDQWVLDSPYNNAMAHYLNLSCFLGGAQQRRSATVDSVKAELYRARDIESCDTAALHIATGEGPTIHFYVTHCSAAQFGPVLQVQGDKGVIAWQSSGESTITGSDGQVEHLNAPPASDLRGIIGDHIVARFNDPSAFICDLNIAGAQTRCSTLAHESATIHTIDPRFTRRAPWKDSTITIIEGIDQLFPRAYETCATFADAGAPWAVR